MSTLYRDGGSFRDDLGYVYSFENRILRVLSKQGRKHFEGIYKLGILDQLYKAGYIVKTNIVKDKKLQAAFPESHMILEHSKIDHITYPYEWSFEQLKFMAIFHLDLQLYLLERGFVLRDASAYNLQFSGSSAIFIDVLSIALYENGEIWYGYKQFCENFLFPLLLNSKVGVSHRQFYRGNIEGISREEITALLPLRCFFSLDVISHIVVPKLMLAKEQSTFSNAQKLKMINKTLSITKYRAILQNLRNWITTLENKKSQSFWSEYSYNNSYTKLEENLKIKTLKNFIRKYKINSFLDIGCNTGIYSIAALSQGPKYGISIDSDEKSIDKLFIKAKLEKLNLLPLCVDLTNPSPNQGWLQSERKGFQDRFFTDASFSLAFMHHLVISKNIPLQQAIQFLVQFSDRGIIEYVPMDDEMAQILLRQRRNEITKYTKEEFEFELMRTKNIISKTKVKATGRILYEYA